MLVLYHIFMCPTFGVQFSIISLFTFVLFAIITVVFVTYQAGVMTAFAAEQEANIIAIRYDASIKELTHLASIEENFEDDKVIVILDHQKSKINGTVSLNDFSPLAGNIEFDSIKDEFRIADLEKYQKGNTNFRQILSLTLKEGGKENVIKAVMELEKIDGVLLAQPEYIYGIQDDWTPNDTSYGQQWALTATHGIQAENAWNITRGNNGVTVGIMENGIQANHPDLSVVAGNFIPATGFAAGHGTHVAGIIAAIGNNSRGVTGVSQSQISVLSRANLRATLEWAQNNDIRAINASYYYTRVVDGATVPALPDANHATAIQNYNGLFIASAGNSGRTNLGNTDNTPQYPSGYGDARKYPNINNVISVGSLNNVSTTNAQRSDFSCFGANSVHIYAPGGNILSAFPDDLCDGIIHAESGFRNCEEPVLSGGIWFRSHTHHADGYHYMNGTSMAAPQVTGVAALILSINPNLTPVQLRDTILNNADSVTIQIPNPAGGTTFVNQTVSRLNAFKAVSSVAFTSNLVSGGISITGFKTGFILQNNTNLVIPDRFAPVDTATQQNIVAIGSSAFVNQTQLSHITLPDTIISIAPNAFENCTSLTSITLPNNLTSIENSTFKGCTSLGSINIPNSVTSIGSEAFSYCSNLTDITISTSLTSIENETFKDCKGLTSITIPNSVTTIGASAFENCDNLVIITLPSNLTTIGTEAFLYCKSIVNITIPNSVMSIGSKAFLNCINLNNVTIPQGIEVINDGTFGNCYEFTEIIIPSSVTRIGSNAFGGCSGLSNIVIPSGVTNIGTKAFINCSGLTEVTIPSTVTSIGLNVFYGCNNLSLTWEYNPSLTAIGLKERLTKVIVMALAIVISPNTSPHFENG
jgi:subtilisin family serine protease